MLHGRERIGEHDARIAELVLHDGKLLGAVCRVFVNSVLDFYRRHMRERGIDSGKSGAVTVVQRVSSDLRLNPHFHTIALDGVFVEDETGELTFHALPCLTTHDVADVLQTACARIVALLSQLGVAEDALANEEPALARLAQASAPGVAPAGPALHQRPAIALGSSPKFDKQAGLCVSGDGWSLHAATTTSAGDAVGREALCKYVLRPPIAQERLKLLQNDLVRIVLKRPFSDGTFAVDLDPPFTALSFGDDRSTPRLSYGSLRRGVGGCEPLARESRSATSRLRRSG